MEIVATTTLIIDANRAAIVWKTPFFLMVEQKSYQRAILHLDSQEGDHSIVVKQGGDIFWAEQLFQLLALSLLVESVKHHAHVHALKTMICAMHV